MPKKKKTRNNKHLHNPFSSLKGFTVSAELPTSSPSTEQADRKNEPLQEIDFDSHMTSLGVRPLDTDEQGADEGLDAETQEVEPSEQKTEEATFLAAMQQLEVQFSDAYIENDQEASATMHQPRRMKQLSKGTLVPQATLDLHGVKRQEVAARLTAFIINARYHGWYVLLVITGKGLHSTEGKGVLRHAVEEFLHNQGRDQVSEWGRAPRQYGGDGAIVLFLRRQQS